MKPASFYKTYSFVQTLRAVGKKRNLKRAFNLTLTLFAFISYLFNTSTINQMKFFAYIAIFILGLNYCNLQAQNSAGNSPERLYIHTDRDAYVAGEEIYYKIYQTSLNKIQRSKYAYLLFRNINNFNIVSTRIELNNNLSYGKFLLPDTLSTGIYQIVGFTNCLRNDPENSFFTKSLIVANRFDKELHNLDAFATSKTVADTISPANDKTPEINQNGYLSVQVSKNIFKKREKIVLDLKVNKNHNIQSANVSISVKSLIPGYNEHNSILTYFNKTDKQNFNWNNCKFLLESQGVIISGTVLDKELKKPMADQIILLSTPDSVPNLQYTTTSLDGSFKFLLSDFYFGKNIYIKLKDNRNAKIDLDNKYHVNIPFNTIQIEALKEVKNYLNRNQDFVTIQKDYFEQKDNGTTSVPAKYNKFPHVYAKPHSTVRPSDYLELPDFIEISRELLPTLKIRKQKTGYEANILNTLAGQYMPNAPVIFLDGIPLDNINQIVSLGSAKIKSIDVCSTERFFGDLMFDGILSVNTGKKELANIKWENPLITYWELNDQPLATYDFNIARPDKNYPNYKQLLYWEPNQTVISDKQFVFYASDNTGYFEINIQGITTEGLPISVQKTIQIVNE